MHNYRAAHTTSTRPKQGRTALSFTNLSRFLDSTPPANYSSTLPRPENACALCTTQRLSSWEACKTLFSSAATHSFASNRDLQPRQLHHIQKAILIRNRAHNLQSSCTALQLILGQLVIFACTVVSHSPLFRPRCPCRLVKSIHHALPHLRQSAPAARSDRQDRHHYLTVCLASHIGRRVAALFPGHPPPYAATKCAIALSSSTLFCHHPLRQPFLLRLDCISSKSARRKFGSAQPSKLRDTTWLLPARVLERRHARTIGGACSTATICTTSALEVPRERAIILQNTSVPPVFIYGHLYSTARCHRALLRPLHRIRTNHSALCPEPTTSHLLRPTKHL